MNEAGATRSGLKQHRRPQAVRWPAHTRRQRGYHRTDLRNYAGEQGVPFRGDQPDTDVDHPQSIVNSWWFIGSGLVIASWGLWSAAQGWL